MFIFHFISKFENLMSAQLVCLVCIAFDSLTLYNRTGSREVRLNLSFVAKNYLYFFLKGVTIRSNLLFISSV